MLKTSTTRPALPKRRSIKEWGWTTPALVGKDGGLIAGHARILAARQLGIAEIPVMVAAGWSEDFLQANTRALREVPKQAAVLPHRSRLCPSNRSFVGPADPMPNCAR